MPSLHRSDQGMHAKEDSGLVFTITTLMKFHTIWLPA